MTRLVQAVALACGVDGAFVDVSLYANLSEGTQRSWGRQSEFEDAGPGTFQFTLDNGDGRFNPGSTILDTPVTEGMGVCWDLGGRLVAGTVLAIEPSFPDAESAWAQVTITCDDMLGNAARHEIGSNLGTEMVLASTPYVFYPLIDSSERSGNGWFTPAPDGSGVVYGAEGPAGDTQVTFTGSPISQELRAYSPVPLSFSYPSESIGVVGVWVTPSADAAWFFEIVTGTSSTDGLSVLGSASSTRAFINAGNQQVFATGAALQAGVPSYVAAVGTYVEAAGSYTYTIDLYVNGALAATNTTAATTAFLTTFRLAQLGLSAAAATEYVKFSHASHTGTLVHEERAVAGVSEAIRLSGIASVVPEITVDTLPTLSSAPLGAADDGGQAALDAFNGVIRAEQGAIYSATTGTLTSPVEKVTVRARDRVADVDFTFNAETEASGATDFIRDITNMAQTITADGPDTSVSYTDTDLTARVGSKNISETVPLRDRTDLYTWATDRSWRGANVALRAASITIDALTTPTDRSADLLAVVPGDRIQITGLPASLGFTTWDGWFLGADEHHSLTEHTFTLYLQPVLPRPIILDTDLLAAGDDVTLTSDINSSVTSISLTSTSGLWTTGADLPHVIRIGAECMTLTAVSGASSPQTGTVTRAAVDPLTGVATTAAAQVAGTQIELADPAYIDF